MGSVFKTPIVTCMKVRVERRKALWVGQLARGERCPRGLQNVHVVQLILLDFGRYRSPVMAESMVSDLFSEIEHD